MKEKLLASGNLKKWDTPFYIYDLGIIKRNYENLQGALGKRFKIFYSMKANPHHKILNQLKKLEASLDISSQGEMKKALAAGFSGEELSFVGPGKTKEELSDCLANEVKYIVIESFLELKMLAGMSPIERVQKFCIRINPRSFFSPEGKKKENKPSQFGFDESELFLIKDFLTKNSHLALTGFHFYTQSQYFDPSIIFLNFRLFLDISFSFQAYFNCKLEMINMGGGFGIPYFHGQSQIDLNNLKNEAGIFLKSDKVRRFNGVSFFVESGRFIAGPAGFFITKVLYIKKSSGRTYAICDGGMTQHQSAIGVGQVIKRSFPIDVLSFQKEAQIESENVTICGPSCYSIDVFGNDILLPKLSEGDFIMIGQSGAYGPSFSPGNFLSRPLANEYIYETN